MELANIMLNVGEDGSSIIPRWGVTPAEVAVLRLIHGDDAVNDIQILEGEALTDGKKRTHRQEIARLMDVYGKPTPEGGREAPAVSRLFPGAAARVFESFEELELDESLYKATGRATTKPESETPVEAPPADALVPLTDQLTISQLKTIADEENVDLGDATRKADIIAKIEIARAGDRVHAAEGDIADGPTDEDDDDGIDDMSDRTNVFE